MTRTTPTDVRKALRSNAVEYPSEELGFHIGIAHRIVERRCAPHTNDEEGLKDTETYVAAALAVGAKSGDVRYSSITQESAQVSFDWEATRELSGPASSLWETALLVDPSGRLDDPGDDAVWTVAFGGSDADDTGHSWTPGGWPR